jgi:hypothetical protein
LIRKNVGAFKGARIVPPLSAVVIPTEYCSRVEILP